MTANAMEEFPKHLQGILDAIQIAYLSVVLVNDTDWASVAKNVKTSRNPGGMLQLIELNICWGVTAFRG